MDMTQSIVPKSDQINAEDLLTGPVTVTIAEVLKGSAEQPVNVELAEFPGRPYRPSKSMRRVMVAAWGKEASEYTGRRMTLYRDPEVTFGRDKVGGIKIAAMSHIDRTLSIALTVTRGKRAPHTVQPLTDDAPPQPKSSPPKAGGITDDQRKNLHRLCALLNLDRDQKLAGCSAVTGRQIDSTSHLTQDEARICIDRLTAKLADNPATPDPAGDPV